MSKKHILKNVSQLCGVVQRVMQKSLKRAQISSEDILLQIFQNDYFVQQGLYEQFLKELESRHDPQTKKKD